MNGPLRPRAVGRAPGRVPMSRRAALLLPLATAGCGLFDNWFGDNKPPLLGTRIPVMPVGHALDVDNPDARRVALPPPAANPSWPQAGGNAAHAMGHLAARDVLSVAWQADIGAGGGYRRKITARPVVAGGRVFAMDSDANITAFDERSGSRLWRLNTRAKHDRSSNVGGGLGWDGGVLYATTGRGDALAIDPADGHVAWRQTMGNAARAAPTIADGRLFIPLIDGELVALSAADGRRLWSYQGGAADTEALGLPSPAYADGIVVAGFGSGDLVGLRASSGLVVWSDTLASGIGRTSLIDLSSVRAMPVIADGAVFAIGLGGLMVSLDLRSGRRVWERNVGSGETPWLAGDWLFILSSDMQAAALSRSDGAVAWVTPLPRYKDDKDQTGPIRWIGPTLIADRLVFAGSIDRAVALSPYTGRVLGRQELSGAASVEPVVAGGTLFIVTDDAMLSALR